MKAIDVKWTPLSNQLEIRCRLEGRSGTGLTFGTFAAHLPKADILTTCGINWEVIEKQGVQHGKKGEMRLWLRPGLRSVPQLPQVLLKRMPVSVVGRAGAK
jgi:hypothetical protein